MTEFSIQALEAAKASIHVKHGPCRIGGLVQVHQLLQLLLDEQRPVLASGVVDFLVFYLLVSKSMNLFGGNLLLLNLLDLSWLCLSPQLLGLLTPAEHFSKLLEGTLPGLAAMLWGAINFKRAMPSWGNLCLRFLHCSHWLQSQVNIESIPALFGCTGTWTAKQLQATARNWRMWHKTKEYLLWNYPFQPTFTSLLCLPETCWLWWTSRSSRGWRYPFYRWLCPWKNPSTSIHIHSDNAI